MYSQRITLNCQNRLVKARKTRQKLNSGVSAAGVFSFAKRWLFLLVVVAFLGACSDEFEEVIQSPLGKVQITTSNNSVYLSEIGSQYTTSAKLVDEQGVAYVDQPSFTWASDSSAIATVDVNGVITAKAFGQAVVTVSTSEFSSDIQVVISADVVTLNGTARYEDREYGSSGFITQQNYYKAIRFAKVSVVDINGSPVGGIGSVYTDANGQFAVSGILNSQHYVHIAATTDNTLGLDLLVKDRQSAIYSISKQVDVQQADNFAMDVPLSSDASGAFNILDVLTSSAQFTLEYTNTALVSLSAFWEINNSDGTYFCSNYDSVYCKNGRGVYIYNSVNGDTDEYDDDVLYHEFGHYFANENSRDDSYGGCHVLSSTDLDLRLAWSEGWGDFFPAAVKTWLAADVSRSGLISSQPGLTLTAYVDTYQSGAQIFIALDSLSSSVYKSAANELAVAKILYESSQRFGMQAVIDVLVNYLPGVGSLSVNLETFWDGWLATQLPNSADKAEVTAFYSERSVFYQEDQFESDNVINSSRKVNLNTSETHYLYSEQLSTDVDFVGFDTVGGNQYTLTTSGLTSGADTYIRVFNADGTPLTVSNVVVENDDANPDSYYGYDGSCGTSRIKNSATALSSSVSFLAPSTGTYYAELRTTLDTVPYLFAGRYGTFNFKVVQN